MSFRHRFLPGPAALLLGVCVTSASAQELRVFQMNPPTGQIVHWSATSNLGPMGAFLQSYSFGGDIVVDFDSTPAQGVARFESARLRIPNTVVAAVLGGPSATVFWRDIVLDATSPDFLIVPEFPASTFATTLDLVVSSGFVQIEPPFGPSLQVPVDGMPLGSIPISGSFPTPGPAQGLRIDGFSFGMDFSAPGFTGTFTHDVSLIDGTASCPAPIPYCPPDPTNPNAGVQLRLAGSTSVQVDDFVLTVTGATPNSIGIYFYGQRAGEASSGVGTVCVGGPLTRLGHSPIDPGGAGSLRVQLGQHQTGPAALAPGTHHSFQFWHRVATPTGPSWDFSNALAVTFCP